MVLSRPKQPLLRRQLQPDDADGEDPFQQGSSVLDRLWVDLQCQVSNDPPEDGQEIPDLNQKIPVVNSKLKELQTSLQQVIS